MDKPIKVETIPFPSFSSITPFPKEPPVLSKNGKKCPICNEIIPEEKFQAHIEECAGLDSSSD